MVKQEPIDHTFINELREVNKMLDPVEPSKPIFETKSRSSVFAELKRLDILSRTLMEHEGFLIKMSPRKKPRRVWCHIRDKKFKWYKDGPTKGTLSGTLDFDLYVC
jgi:hypothetical protein